MHLFLYQAARHTKPTGYYSRRRFSQSSIRSDFDLELLKKGIKGRYEIMGHGQHPFQLAMSKMGMEEEFYGHLIMIEDSKNAVWFKLNYDNIGKNQTKYLGGWRDLNAEDLVPYITRYQLLKTKDSHLVAHRGTVSSQFYSLQQMIHPRQPVHGLMDEARKAGLQYEIELNLAKETLTKEIDSNLLQIKAVQDEVRDYLKKHKG